MKLDRYIRFRIPKRLLKRVVREHVNIENNEMRKYEYPDSDDTPTAKLEDWYAEEAGSIYTTNALKVVGRVGSERLLFYDKKGRFTESPLTKYLREKDRLLAIANGNFDSVHVKQHGRLRSIALYKKSVNEYIKAYRNKRFHTGK